MPADPGDLLEQRSPLLGAQGQGLVDHALPDEQEGVVGEVRGVEQVDQVAQPDPALVEEVVVLARAVQPAAELEHLEVDRQEPVGVVEHERDVRHALRGALVRAGPDDVLRAPRAKGAALLAERPAQGIGEVALARPVRPDDGADSRAELDVRAFGEGLEPLQAKRQQARLGGRPVGQRHAPVPSCPDQAPVPSGPDQAPVRRSCSSAWAAAAVSAVRREGPSPTPSSSPSTQTSIRNDFS